MVTVAHPALSILTVLLVSTVLLRVRLMVSVVDQHVLFLLMSLTVLRLELLCQSDRPTQWLSRLSRRGLGRDTRSLLVNGRAMMSR